MNTTPKSNSPKTCKCQCGLPVTSKVYYRPGHDARHAGNVGRRVAEVLIREGRVDGSLEEKDLALYNELPSGALKAKAKGVTRNAITKKAKAPKERTPRATSERAPGTPRPLSVKVGRWTYPARVTRAGKVERNLKRDGSGSWEPVGPNAKVIS